MGLSQCTFFKTSVTLFICSVLRAEVAELVDALVSNTCGLFVRAGSTPAFGTIYIEINS